MRHELDTVADEWQLALDFAASALDACDDAFASGDLHARRLSLAHERAETAGELAALAHDIGVTHRPWLAPVRVSQALLGLPDHVEACIFDLDGVLSDSSVLHAAAWAEVFDELLLHLAHRMDVQFVPFDRDGDYRAYIDGRPRLDGIHAFLQSRGIRLPEGRPEDPADAASAHGLARHKGEALQRRLRRRGVNALPGARRYLEAVGRAGLGRAVVSSSTRTLPMLELAEIDSLVDARVDAEQIAAGELRSRPAPDIVLRACELLGAAPAHTATFVHSPDGIAAGTAAGLVVVGVGADAPTRERLRAFGAPVVVERLAELLDRRLLAAAA